MSEDRNSDDKATELAEVLRNLDFGQHQPPMKPYVYSGKPKDAISFLEDFSLYSKFKKWDDKQKLEYIPAFLQGPSRQW